MQVDLFLSQRAFIRLQFGIITVLLFLSVWHYSYEAIFDVRSPFGIFGLRERNVSTWFSSFNLLISSIFLFIIYQNNLRSGQDGSRYWLLLCIVFFLFSVDEVAAAHERLGKLKAFTGNIFPVLETHHWVLYGSIFTVVAFIVFLPFLMKLPKRTALAFLLAGGIFVTGVIGFEFVGAVMIHTDFAQRGDLIYNLRRVLEEGCEMYAIAIFNCTLLREVILRNIFLTMKASTT